MHEVMMAMAFVKSMSIPLKVSGRCCEAGFDRIGAFIFMKKNVLFISAFLNFIIMFVNEIRPCFIRW